MNQTMNMSDQTDTQLIMMVAQVPFETPDMNQFCKLIPIAHADGTRLVPADFPNDGEIWWMLTAHTSRLAEAIAAQLGRTAESRWRTRRPQTEKLRPVP